MPRRFKPKGLRSPSPETNPQKHRIRAMAKAPEDIDRENLTLRVTYTTEEPVLKPWYWHPEGKDQPFYEVLVCTDEAIDTTRADTGTMACLDNHWTNDLSRQLGTSVPGTHLAGDGEASVEIAFRKNYETAVNVFADIADGTLRGWSTIYDVDEYEDRDEEIDGIPVYYAIKWGPYSADPVTIPADPFAGVRANHQTVEDDVDEENVATKAQQTETPAEKGPEVTDPTPQEPETKRNEVKFDLGELYDLAEISGKDIGWVREKSAYLSSGKITMAEVRAELRASLTAERGNQFSGAPSVTPGDPDHDRQKYTLWAAAFAKRAGLHMDGFSIFHKRSKFGDEFPDEGHHLARLPAADLLREFCYISGIETRGMDLRMITGSAMGIPIDKSPFGGSMLRTENVTSMYTMILTDMVNTVMEMPYSGVEAPRSYEKLVHRRRPVSDYREIHSVDVFWQARLQHLPEGAKIEVGSAGMEDGRSYRIKRLGGGVSFSHKFIRNDNLNAIGQQARSWRDAVTFFEREEIFAPLLEGNAVVSEHVKHEGPARAFFSAENGNDFEIPNLKRKEGYRTLERSLNKQARPDGQRMGLRPKYFMIPEELENEAIEQIIPITATQSEHVNTLIHKDYKLELVIVPEFDDWVDEGNDPVVFLTANPLLFPILEVAHLDGVEQFIITEQKTTAELDLEMKGVFTFGSLWNRWHGISRGVYRPVP